MSKEEVKNLKDIIRELREEGYSYEELAAEAGVSSTTILRIDKDKTNPRIKTVKKITKALENIREDKTKEKLRGFTSPFTQNTKIPKESLESSYEEIMDMLINFIQDDNVPKKYKKNLLRIIRHDILSFESMTDNNE